MLLVPFIHLSVYLFRTLHPQPIVLKPSAPSLPPEMLRTLLVSMAVFTLLYIGPGDLRYGLANGGGCARRGDRCRLRRRERGYMVAAYVVAPVILVGIWCRCGGG